MSFTSYLAGTPLPAFIVRKEPKGHGTGQWIEGRSALADRAEVAVVEDVVTTGACTLKAIERVQAEGLQRALRLRAGGPAGGRPRGGRRQKGYGLSTLFTRSDFLP